MLGEIIEWIKTPAPKLVRKMGYVYSAVALRSRHKRQSKAWSNHVQNCFELWDVLLEKYQPQSITIVGSGPLSELPVELILSKVQKLVLLDIVHPLNVRQLAKENSKIKLIELDVTGFIDWVKPKKDIKKAPLDFKPDTFQFETDLVVSANILSQLSLEPEWYLNRKKSISRSSDLMTQLIDKLGKDHITWLLDSAKNSKVVLYTDIERKYLSADKALIEKHPSRVPEMNFPIIKKWDWELSPLGEEAHDYSIQMHVCAFELLSK